MILGLSTRPTNFRVWAALLGQSKFEDTRLRRLDPSSVARALSRRRRRMARLRAGALRAGTSRPVDSLVIRLGMPPTSEAITGLALAPASSSTLGKLSVYDGSTNISA